MIVLLPGNNRSFRSSVATDVSMYGWLITPRRPMCRSTAAFTGVRFGVDNECYSLGDKFDPSRYLRFLNNVAHCSNAGDCLFATAPDVVADAHATLAKFPAWCDTIRGLGLPVALVAQDGLENEAIPWQGFDALFIGGSTTWKLGQAARDIIREAQSRGKWVHMGRVNGNTRLSYAWKLGVDSVDGTGWAMYPDKHIRRSTNHLTWLRQQLPLLAQGDAPCFTSLATF